VLEDGLLLLLMPQILLMERGLMDQALLVIPKLLLADKDPSLMEALGILLLEPHISTLTVEDKLRVTTENQTPLKCIKF